MMTPAQLDVALALSRTSRGDLAAMLEAASVVIADDPHDPTDGDARVTFEAGAPVVVVTPGPRLAPGFAWAETALARRSRMLGALVEVIAQRQRQHLEGRRSAPEPLSVFALVGTAGLHPSRTRPLVAAMTIAAPVGLVPLCSLVTITDTLHGRVEVAAPTPEGTAVVVVVPEGDRIGVLAAPGVSVDVGSNVAIPESALALGFDEDVEAMGALGPLAATCRWTP